MVWTCYQLILTVAILLLCSLPLGHSLSKHTRSDGIKTHTCTNTISLPADEIPFEVVQTCVRDQL